MSLIRLGSRVRRHLRCRRQRVQTEDPRHRRQLWAPRAPQPEHEGGDRSEGMTVDLSKINRPARAAARAEHVESRRPRDQRGPDRRRPQDVAAGGKLLVPALDDALVSARGSVGNLPLRVDGNVEASCPHAHCRSISGIEPSIQPMRLASCVWPRFNAALPLCRGVAIRRSDLVAAVSARPFAERNGFH
jgi:hypothetical protein